MSLSVTISKKKSQISKMASLASQLPPIKVGGQVTQQVIRHVPSPPAKGTSIGSPFQRSSRGIQRPEGSFIRSPPSDLKKPASTEKIDTSRYDYVNY